MTGTDFPDLPNAACASMGPQDGVWFPEKGNQDYAARSAKTICAGCPEQVACLEYALARPDVQGVWGGTTGNERMKMRVKAGAVSAAQRAATTMRAKYGTATCGTVGGYHKHRRAREKPCDDCMAARRLHVAHDRQQQRESA